MAEGRKGLPLRPTLVSVVVALILAGAGGVGVLAYQSSTRIVSEFWHGLSDEIASTTMQRTLRYLEPARPYVALTQQRARGGALDRDDPMAMLDWFRGAIEANPEFTWASWGGADGTYLAAHRTPEGELRATWRSVQDGGGTLNRVYAPDGDGWRLIDEERMRYDPRERPWYRAVEEGGEATWVEPFLFATVHEPGFMYAAPDRTGGRLHGVWAVEYEVSYLSEFLGTLHPSEHGRVYVVTRDGLVVGHPEGEVTREQDGEVEIARAEGHPDAMLSGAWRAWHAHDGDGRRFTFGDHLAMAEPFPAHSGIDWVVLVVVPEGDFFGPVRAQAGKAAVLALVAALVAVLFGVIFSTRVAGALTGVAEELDRIGDFDLEDRDLSATRSRVREVSAMGAAARRMKGSLRSFGRYVPRELVIRLLRSGQEAELGGKNREITVLFSDIARFTTIAEQMDPDALVAELGEYFEALSDAVRAHGGTVDKYIGDSIMAFWGAPEAREDHALAACRGALAMMERVRELDAAWKAEGRPAFETRIGVNTGTALVGNIGSPDRMNYTAMGDAVNVASRIEGLNKFYGTRVLVGESTARLVEGELVLRPLDWVAVKGKEKAVQVLELVGERGEVPDDVLAAIQVYQDALALYRDREFERAAARFDEALEAFGGDDTPSRKMAERARRYAAEPPAEGWDGSHVMTEK